MEMTTNKQVLDFVNSRAKLVGAGKIVWITGEKEQYDQHTKEAIASGEMIEHNQEMRPGWVLHRTTGNEDTKTDKTA